jgi:hypothetical protein
LDFTMAAQARRQPPTAWPEKKEPTTVRTEMEARPQPTTQPRPTQRQQTAEERRHAKRVVAYGLRKGLAYCL